MLRNYGRYAPLSGVLAAILGLAGSALLIQHSAPGASAGGTQVIAFYRAHHTGQTAGAILFTFAFIFFLFFAGTLRTFLRARPGLDVLSGFVFAGGIIELVGQTINGGFGYALANSYSSLTPAAAQTINVLSNDIVLTSAAGLCIFGVASGIAILRGADLPRWLGWLALVIGVVVVTPAEGLAFVALVAWMAVVSILVFQHDGKGEDASSAGSPG
jgi:hypothetical protein